MRPQRIAGLIATCLVLLGACGSDEDVTAVARSAPTNEAAGAMQPEEAGISDQAAWCAVLGQVDDLFDTIDNGSHDFATKQAGYEDIRRLVAQLEHGIGHTDPSARDDLAATLAFARALTTAVVEAEDSDAAEQAVQSLVDRTRESLPGAEWMRDTCGIDVDA